MRWFRAVAPVFIAVAVSLVLPAEAEAQWEWIRKLSGPGFTKSFVYRVDTCVFGERKCVTVGAGTAMAFRAAQEPKEEEEELPPRDKVEKRLGLVVNFAWDGENLDSGIEDIKMLALEEQASMMLTRWRPGWPRVFSLGIGFHRFSGGGIDGHFWRTAIIQTAAWRYEWGDKEDDADTGKEYVDEPTWFIEGGGKLRYFFSRLRSEDFGGIPEGGPDGGEIGASVYFLVGYSWGFR